MMRMSHSSAVLLWQAAALFGACSAFQTPLPIRGVRTGPPAMPSRLSAMRPKPSDMCVSAQLQPETESISRRDLMLGVGAVGLAPLMPLEAFADEIPLGSSRRPVVVIGAAGKTGKECVNILLKRGGYGIRAAVRGEIDKEAFGSEDLPPDDIDLVTGVDVTKPETLAEVFQGAGAVIFTSSASKKGGTAEAVDCIGVENVGKACIEAGVERLVVLSSVSVSRPDSFAYKFTNVFGNVCDYKAQGEMRLREVYKGQSKLSYTIIRPGGLSNGKGVGVAGLAVTQGDRCYTEIDRADVAEVAIASIFFPSTHFTTFELSKKDGVKPLQGEFKDSMFAVSGKHTTEVVCPSDTIYIGKECQPAYTEFFNGLKKDSEYDVMNGYVPKKPAKA